MEMPVNCKDLKHLLTEASPHIDPWRLGWWSSDAQGRGSFHLSHALPPLHGGGLQSRVCSLGVQKGATQTLGKSIPAV